MEDFDIPLYNKTYIIQNKLDNIYINLNEINKLINNPNLKLIIEFIKTILNEKMLENEDDITLSPLEVLNKKTKKILIFSGGGIKGIAYIGILKALTELKIIDNIHTFVGTSIGALILVLYIIGYTHEELYNFVIKFDFKKAKSINIFKFLENYGLDDGNKFEYVINRLIKAKNIDPNISLEQLYKLTNKKIILTTVCLNSSEVCYLSHESHPELSLITAIRMSTSIPIYYKPVIYNNLIYIDGGCIDNYPIHLFRNNLDEVIGFYLVQSCENTNKFNNLEEYIMRVIQCLMVGASFNSKKGFENYTLDIDTTDVNFIDFWIETEKKDKLINFAYNYTLNNISKIN